MVQNVTRKATAETAGMRDKEKRRAAARFPARLAAGMTEANSTAETMMYLTPNHGRTAIPAPAPQNAAGRRSPCEDDEQKDEDRDEGRQAPRDR